MTHKRELGRRYRLALIPETVVVSLNPDPAPGNPAPAPGDLGVETRVEFGAPILVDGDFDMAALKPVCIDKATQKLVYEALLSWCGWLDPGVRKAVVGALGRKYRKYKDEKKRLETSTADAWISEVKAWAGIDPATGEPHINPATDEPYTANEIKTTIELLRAAAGMRSGAALRQRRLRHKKESKLHDD